MNAWPISQRPIWPFDIAREDNTLKSEQTNGVVIRRLRYPTARKKLGPFTWQYLSEADYALLMAFYDANTVLPFNFTYYTRAGSVTKTVCFAEPPKETYAGIGWQVQCTFDEV